MLENRIKNLRKNAKMNQEELAKKIGVGRTTITEYECGRIQPPLDKIQAMADVFGVPVSYLTGDDFNDETQDISITLQKMIEDLKTEDVDFMVDGQIITNEQKSIAAAQIESTLKMIQYMNRR